MWKIQVCMIIWYTERYYAELQYVDFPGGSDGKASAYDVGDPGLIPGLGRSPGEENDNPLQYFCVENSMDRGAWRAIVHGVTNSHNWATDAFLFQANKKYKFTVGVSIWWPLLKQLRKKAKSYLSLSSVFLLFLHILFFTKSHLSVSDCLKNLFGLLPKVTYVWV